MEKIGTSLGCPKCKSSNIQFIIEYCNEKTEINAERGSKTSTRRKVYKCNCNQCGHFYSVDHGIEKYVLFEKQCQIGGAGDINLLATFESQSEFLLDYKICSITPSPYDDFSNPQEVTYLMIIEGENYPVIISSKSAQEMAKTPEKARRLVINTVASRHR